MTSRTTPDPLNPKVISGMQGPENALLDETKLSKEEREVLEAEERGRVATNLDTLPTTVVVFQSRFSDALVKLTNLRKIASEIPGEPPEIVRPLYLKFVGGLCQVDTDPDINAQGEKIVKLAKRHRDYGLGRDFWDAREAQEAADRAEANQARETIERLAVEKPELIYEVMERLGKVDGTVFSLPSRPAPNVVPETNVVPEIQKTTPVDSAEIERILGDEPETESKEPVQAKKSHKK